MAWPKDSRPPKPISRLKAQANSAKHITFIMNTGYTTSGASGEDRQHHDEGDLLVSHFCVPNRPAGLISSTIAMMMKITVFDASG